jgi:hypothetical protein
MFSANMAATMTTAKPKTEAKLQQKYGQVKEMDRFKRNTHIPTTRG